MLQAGGPVAFDRCVRLLGQSALLLCPPCAASDWMMR